MIEVSFLREPERLLHGVDNALPRLLVVVFFVAVGLLEVAEFLVLPNLVLLPIIEGPLRRRVLRRIELVVTLV